MEIPPPRVLAQLDAIIVGQSRAANDGARATSSVEVPPDDDDQSVTSAAFGIESSATSFSAPRHVLLELGDDDDDRSLNGDSTIAYDSGDETAAYDGDGEAADALTTASSRFWGVTWERRCKKWQAYYTDADGKNRYLGLFDDEEEAARAVNKAIRDAGLEGQRRMNAVDATGALVPRDRSYRDRSAVIAPDPARDPTATSSKFWGVSWCKRERRWLARYADANGKRRRSSTWVSACSGGTRRSPSSRGGRLASARASRGPGTSSSTTSTASTRP